MSSLSYDDLALSLLVALLLPNVAFAEAENDTGESSSNQEELPSTMIHVSNIQELKPRRPVETPPTEYLPYPPPDNYRWPPGMNAGNENPQPSEFNPPAGWYTGQSGSSSSSSQTSAASSPLRPPLIFRLLASSLGTSARRISRISRPSIPTSQLDTQHPTYNRQTLDSRPPGAIPSIETPPTTSESTLPPSWPLLSSLLLSAHARSALVPRDPLETPPTEYLPYPPPADYVWPAGQSPGNESPQPSEFDSPGGWYGSAAGGQGAQGGYGTPGYSSPEIYGGLISKSSHQGPTLGPGAIAGIVVGGVVFVMLLLFCVWRARKIRRRKAEGGGGPPMAEPGSEAS